VKQWALMRYYDDVDYQSGCKSTVGFEVLLD
jgi:hypothetical protein